MRIQVCSKKEVLKCLSESSEPTLVISINCSKDDPPPLFIPETFLKEVVYLYFDDVEDGHSYSTAIFPMSTKDAQKVKEAVLRQKDSITRIVVHCSAGISRSAGVAAAIGKYLNGDDSFIFSSEKFCPNMTCYRKVLSAFMC